MIWALLLLIIVVGLVIPQISIDDRSKKLIYLVLLIAVILWALMCFNVVGNWGFYNRGPL